MKYKNLIYIAFFFLLSRSVFCQDLASLIPVAPFMKVAEVTGGNDLIKGLSMKSIVFSAKNKSNKDILVYYDRLWKGQIKSVDGSDWYYHTNFNGQYLTVVQVKKTASSSFGVTGIISISEPGKNKEQLEKPYVEIFYPFPSGTKVMSDLSAVDRGETSRTTVFDVPGEVYPNLQFYQSHFERKGWQEVHKDMAQEMVGIYGAASLVMQKSGDELIISFIPGNSGRIKVVGVYVDK